MKFLKAILLLAAFVVSLAIIFFVHGAVPLRHYGSALDELVRTIQQIKSRNPDLARGGNRCEELDRHLQKIKYTAGMPMLDVDASWDLKRRLLDAQCKMESLCERTLYELSQLERDIISAQASLNAGNAAIRADRAASSGQSLRTGRVYSR